MRTENVGKKLIIHTNASLLTHTISEQLVDAGLSWITISLNGLSDEQYFKTVGKRVSFEKICEEVGYLFKIHDACHVHVKIMDEYYTKEEKELFVDKFSDRADTLDIEHVTSSWPGIDVEEGVGNDMLSNQILEKGLVCSLMFFELIVHSDGSIGPCRYDYNYRKESLGNVKEVSLKEIWEGEQLYQMRVATLEGTKIPFGLCQVCDYPTAAAGVDITEYREGLLKKIRK